MSERFAPRWVQRWGIDEPLWDGSDFTYYSFSAWGSAYYLDYDPVVAAIMGLDEEMPIRDLWVGILTINDAYETFR